MICVLCQRTFYVPAVCLNCCRILFCSKSAPPLPSTFSFFIIVCILLYEECFRLNVSVQMSIRGRIAIHSAASYPHCLQGGGLDGELAGHTQVFMGFLSRLLCFSFQLVNINIFTKTSSFVFYSTLFLLFLESLCYSRSSSSISSNVEHIQPSAFICDISSYS